MLAHHQSANSQFPAPDALRVQFLQNLAAVGEYPQLCRKVAIINGANNGVRNPKHSPNDELLGIQIRRNGLAGICGDNICKKIKWKARSATDNGTNKTAEMWTAAPLYNLLFWVPLGAKNYYTDAAWGNSSLDVAPGGLFGEQFSDDKETHGTFLAKELIYLLTGDRTNFNININDFTLMPSYNAADLRFPSKNLYLKWDDQNLCGKTPFDYVYAPSENQAHVAISPENSFWFENEARCNTADLPVLFNPNINGANQICSSETYSVSFCNPTNATVTWSISPFNIATVDQNGTVTKMGNGIATLTATVNFCGNQPIIRTKTISVGSPITISTSDRGCNGEYQQLYVTVDPITNGSNWNWYVDYLGFESEIYIDNPTSPGTYMSVKGMGTVRLTYTDACGSAQLDGLTLYSNCYQYRVSVSPNPAKNNINVNLSPDENSSTVAETATTAPRQVLESKGKTILSLFEVNTSALVKQWKYNESKNQSYNLNINGLRKGIYVLQVDRENLTKTTKVIIE